MNYLKIKTENDSIFKNGSFDMHSEYYAEFPLTDDPREGDYKVSDNTVSMTTVECALAKADKKVIALNFANANFPGGAYVLGGNAQEESLCRASMLYYTIKDCGEYYRRNRLHILPDYTDGMIYSENVPIIRKDSGERLQKPVLCGFITSPAVNRRFARPLMSGRRINGIMERRIGRIISLAASKNADTVILGAYGCGVFGNKRDTVYPMFERAIKQYGGNTCEYIFAVPD